MTAHEHWPTSHEWTAEVILRRRGKEVQRGSVPYDLDEGVEPSRVPIASLKAIIDLLAFMTESNERREAREGEPEPGL